MCKITCTAKATAVTSHALPFDDLQYEEYAKTHGNFTSVDLGYTVVNRKFDIILNEG